MQNPLWDYAVRIYGIEGVAPACLELQDRFGIDVNQLLYAAWLAHSRRRLDAEHLGALDASVADWRERVVKPLRNLRRQLHGVPGASDFYRDAKALELRAEREQLDRMYAFFRQAPALPDARHNLLENLAVVAHFSTAGDERSQPAIRTLAALISL